MNELETTSLITNAAQIDGLSLAINLFASLLLGIILQWHFVRFGGTLSGKRELARIIPFLTLIVCLIISVVKTSLALSLGLVGALSIVRFRTPIKEPEELVYLFMAIAIGLGFGASQTKLTLAASLLILIFVSVLRFKDRGSTDKSFYLFLNFPAVEDLSSIKERLNEIVSQKSKRVDLKKIDVDESEIRITLHFDLQDFDTSMGLIESIKKLFPSATVALLDQSRAPGV
jgi:hypothetical protein